MSLPISQSARNPQPHDALCPELDPRIPEIVATQDGPMGGREQITSAHSSLCQAKGDFPRAASP
jgi:hypothetical protein